MKNKKSKFSVAFYLIGTIILITMSTIIVMNFKKDARIYQESLLAIVGNSQSKHIDNAAENSQSDDYETIKFKKSSSPEKSKPAGKNIPNTKDVQGNNNTPDKNNNSNVGP